MRALTQQAEALAARVGDAVAAVAVQVSASDLPSLETLEHRLQDLLAEYRLLLTEITDTRTPDGWSAGLRKADYNPFLRCVVAFASLTSLLAGHVGDSVGVVWGQHLFSARDLGLIRHDPLDMPLPPRAVTRLLADQASDLLGAFVELVALTPGRAHGRTGQVQRQLEEVCRLLGCRERVNRSLGFDLWDTGRFAAELGLDDVRAVEMAERREAVAVRSWTDEWQFPAYQVTGGALRPEVTVVCGNAARRFRGWSLAIWLANNLDETPDFYEDQLGDRGLWEPHWGLPPTGAFNRSMTWPRATVTGELHRITRREDGPFYFSAQPPPPAPPVPTPVPASPAGRFDPPHRTGRGALYTAESGEGACSEVLDREPVVTLREVARRVMWRVRPSAGLDVADLASRSPAKLASSNNRQDTQELGERLSATWRGLRAPLRTNASQVGVVVFGPAGAVLPAAAGLGLWSARAEPLMATEELWTYLEEREEGFSSNFPVVLRRFPEDIDY